MINIILAACFAIILPIEYFMLRNTVKPKKNIILGVTLPQIAHNDRETKKICGSFAKWLNIVTLPLLLLAIPPLFMQTMGAVMMWYTIWVLPAIIAPTAVFAIHRRKLMTLKRAKSWSSAAGSRALVDIKAAALPQKKINGLWFLPPLIASLIPVVHSLTAPLEWELALIHAIFVFMTGAFWLCYYLIFRLRTEVLNENITLTMALTRVRRYNWGKFWLAASWLTGVYSLLLWAFFESGEAVILAISLGYTIILLVFALQTEFAARAAQQKLTAADTGELYLDEDDYWLLGLLYYNPNDRHLLVNQRIGTNMSLNVASPAGKILMILSVLCIAALPFFGMWIWAEERTPTRLILSETALTARHTTDRYVIRLDTIESVKLIEILPRASRVAGTGLTNLYKGRFRVEGFGTSRLCLHPQNPPFLVIRSGGNTYIINDADSGVTRNVYTIKTAR